METPARPGAGRTPRGASADRPPHPAPGDPHAGQALNILFIGSDVRTGQDASIGGVVSGMRSDTTIVMHLPADRSRIDLVSIPRDTLVDIPACARSDGSTSPAQRGQFNAAFSIGSTSGRVSDAAACTIKTVEKDTGVFINDYVVIDFARARTGTGVGDGSDTNRIGRQQQLLAATVREIQSKDLLTDVPSLLQFLSAATSSITASPDLASIPSLAFSLRGTNRVVTTQAAAADVTAVCG